MKVGQKVVVKRGMLDFRNNVHYSLLAGKEVTIERLFPDEKVAYVVFNNSIFSVLIDHLEENEKQPKRPSGVVVANPTELNEAEKLAMSDAADLRFYMVVNHEGQFFRAKGINGYGASWVGEAKKARVYSKIGPARACVTFFSRNKSYPIPKILEIGPSGRRYVL